MTGRSLAAHQVERNGLSRNFFSGRFISGNLWEISKGAKFQGAIFPCDGHNLTDTFPVELSYIRSSITNLLSGSIRMRLGMVKIGFSSLPMPSGEKILTDDPVPHFDRSDNSVSSSVLERAKLGDQDAFRKITQLYAGLVYYWIRQVELSPEHAEDVSQQVFMAVSQNLKTFQRTKPADSFRAWIRVITRSKIADHRRKNTGVERAIGGEESLNEVPDEVKDGEDEDDDRDKAILYQKAVQFIKGEFSDKDCKAFLMLVVDGIPAKDVADNLGMSVNEVYIAKSRILKRLRVEFADLIDDETN